MSVQSKKTFAAVDYNGCSPKKCSPDNGVCAAVSACSHKVLIQIDGAFEPPVIFHDMCMGCWDCIEACPLGAIGIKHIA